MDTKVSEAGPNRADRMGLAQAPPGWLQVTPVSRPATGFPTECHSLAGRETGVTLNSPKGATDGSRPRQHRTAEMLSARMLRRWCNRSMSCAAHAREK